MNDPIRSLRAIGDRLFGGNGTVSVAGTRTLIMPGAGRLPFIKREPAKTVEREAEPGWKTWGWRKKGDAYHGCFRALGNRWRGLVCQKPGGGFDAYILRPPDGVLSGPHGACFHIRPDGWFFIHQSPAPSSVDHAIRSVELVLTGRER